MSFEAVSGRGPIGPSRDSVGGILGMDKEFKGLPKGAGGR